MFKSRGYLLWLACSILALSFIINAGLPWLLSCEGSLWLNGGATPSGGRLGVVLPFHTKELSRLVDALKSWPYPCTTGKLQKDSVLILYGDADLSVTSEVGSRLRSEVSRVQGVGQCFGEVMYLTLPPYTDGSMIYDKREEDGEIGRGRNTLFYTFMLELMSANGSEASGLGLRHVLWMEPDVQARAPGWLERVHREAARPLYWIQGSSYRGKCLPNEADGTCSWVGRDAIGYIGANALYHTADPDLISLLHDTSRGPFALRPFERAIYQHLSMAWPEYRHRDAMHLYERVDWVRDYGRYPAPERVPEHVILLHQEHPVLEEVGDNYVADAENDLDKGLRGEDFQETALNLQQELLQLQSGTPQEGDDSPLKDPPRDRTLTSALTKVATPRKQIVLVLLSDGYHDLLANFLHFASKHGLARHTLVAALDAPSVALLKQPSGVTAWVDLTDHEFRGEGVPPFDAADPEGSLKLLRPSLVRRCLAQGYRVLVSDLDIVWLKNPFQAAYFSDELDFWIQSDSHTGFVETTKGGLREVFVSAGLSYAVPSARTVRFLAAAQHMAREHPELTEQQILRLSLTVNRYRLRWRALEPVLFPNGFLYWEQTFPQSLGIQPIAVHNNMAESRAAKVYRFREAGFWSADEALTPEAVRTGGKKYLAYLGMVFDNGLGNRRVELRQALAISELLGRTLILPAMHREHEEDTPVSVDYFFDVDALSAHFPNVEPRSLLDRAFPDWQTMPVHDIDIKLALPENVTATGRPQDVSWKERLQQVQGEWHPNGATPGEILGWYGDRQEPLLVFYSTFRRFGGFEDQKKDAEFEDRVFKGIVPARKTREVADSIHVAVKAAARQAAGKDEFSCLHVRRKSFLVVHSGTEKSVAELVKLLPEHLPLDRALYVTTDDPSEEMRATLEAAGFPKVMFVGDFYPQWQRSLVEGPTGAKTMRHGQIDQLVCAQAETFVGNEYSTFTFHVAWLRERYGKKQVCRDIYGREKTPGMVYQ